MRDGSTKVTSIAPLLSLAIYLAAVAPPAPPPMTTTLGFPPFAITIGADKLAVTAAAVCINERLFIDIFSLHCLSGIIPEPPKRLFPYRLDTSIYCNEAK